MMRLALALAAALATAAPLAQAEGLTNMTEEERAAFGEAVRAYLLENPEVIMEAITELQAREDKAAVNRDLQMMADNKDAIYNSPDDWQGGNLQGDITIVEFMDYRCTYCHKAFQEVSELVTQDGNIRFVLKEFPILGEQSVLTSKFAIATRLLHGDDAYKKVHDALFAMRGDATDETLSRIAVDLGFDPAAILAKMKAPEVQAVIDGNYALAQIMDISGTPTFVIDQTMVRGYVPLQGMQQIVAEQREG